MSIGKPNTMVPMESGPHWDLQPDEGGSACVWFDVRIGMLVLMVEITNGAMVAYLNNRNSWIRCYLLILRQNNRNEATYVYYCSNILEVSLPTLFKHERTSASFDPGISIEYGRSGG